MKALFNLIPLYGLIGAMIVLGLATGIIAPPDDGDVATLFALGLLSGVFGLVSPLVSVFNHIFELGRVITRKQ